MVTLKTVSQSIFDYQPPSLPVSFKNNNFNIVEIQSSTKISEKTKLRNIVPQSNKCCTNRCALYWQCNDQKKAVTHKKKGVHTVLKEQSTYYPIFNYIDSKPHTSFLFQRSMSEKKQRRSQSLGTLCRESLHTPLINTTNILCRSKMNCCSKSSCTSEIGNELLQDNLEWKFIKCCIVNNIKSNDLHEVTQSEFNIIPQQDKALKLNKPGNLSPTDTLILFDWDDTLLPSSWLLDNQLTLDPLCQPSEDQIRFLNFIAFRGIALLETAVRYGKVVVVTNAEAGWVQLSGAKFIPSLLDTLYRWNVNVISARTHFECRIRRLPLQWKIEAVRYLIRSFFTVNNTNHSQKRNIISFGDSDSERLAVIQTVKKYAYRDKSPNSIWFYKSLKFCENPTPATFLRQLLFVEKLLPRFIQHPGNLDYGFVLN